MAQGATQAWTAAGTLWQIDSTGYQDIIEVLSIEGPDGETEEIEVTSLGSPGTAKEFLLGLIDEGRISAQCNFIPDDTYHQLLETARKARSLQTFKLICSDAGAAEIDYTARLASGAISIAQGSQGTRTWNNRISGQITITP